MPMEGYNVTFQPFANGKPSGEFEIFANGFAGKTPLMAPNDATARANGVAGWVRNRADGSVEAEFEGGPDAVARMVAWCRLGPPRARVESKEDGD